MLRPPVVSWTCVHYIDEETGDLPAGSAVREGTEEWERANLRSADNVPRRLDSIAPMQRRIRAAAQSWDAAWDDIDEGESSG